MNKIITLLTVSLFALPLTAHAASVTILNQTNTGGGTVTDGNGEYGATANHNDIKGTFSDTWQVDIDPTGSVFSLATSNFFSDFMVEYRLDATSSFVHYDGVAEQAGLFSIKDLALNTIPGFQLRVSGTLNPQFNTGGYNVSVNAVPVPAAAWLFGSAMLGLVGATRNRSAKKA